MDFLVFLDKNIAIIMAPVGAIVGAFIGGYLTSKSQKNNITRQIEWDKIKDQKQHLKEALEIYNKILEVDGSKHIVEHNGGHQLEIVLDEYTSHVRPVLYEKFHQLHQDVAEKVSSIDYEIERCNFAEELTDEDSEQLAEMYLDLIVMIKLHLQNYRKNEIRL